MATPNANGILGKWRDASNSMGINPLNAWERSGIEIRQITIAGIAAAIPKIDN